MVLKRVITALWAAALVVGCLWLDGAVPLWTIFVAVWASFALWEVFKMNAVTQFPVLAVCGIIFTLAYVGSPYFGQAFFVPGLLTVMVVISLVVMVFQTRHEHVCGAWVWVIAGTLYIGWLMSFLVRLNMDAGKSWVVLAMFATICSDSMAYFIGRKIGKHKMAPRISPGKTWEGAFAGLGGAILGTLLVLAIFGIPGSWGRAVLFGIVISVMGQVGGMAASVLKRNAGVKDSGSMLPGHGGVLDRTDSVLFAAVTAYLFFLAIQGGWLNGL